MLGKILYVLQEIRENLTEIKLLLRAIHQRQLELATKEHDVGNYPFFSEKP